MLIFAARRFSFNFIRHAYAPNCRQLTQLVRHQTQGINNRQNQSESQILTVALACVDRKHDKQISNPRSSSSAVSKDGRSQFIQSPDKLNQSSKLYSSVEAIEFQDEKVKLSLSTSADRPNFLPLDTTFTNSEEAYKSKTMTELLRALLVYRLTSYNTLVKYNMKILKILRTVLGRRLFDYLMRNSFYGQFVAGADVDDIKPLIMKNHKYGVKSILDYSVEEDMAEEQAKERTKQAYQESSSEAAEEELLQPVTSDSKKFEYHENFGDRRKHVTSARTYFYDSESQCDKTMWTFMKCVDVVSETTEGTGLAAIKLTALGRPQFLLQMSRVLSLMKDIFDELTYDETNVVLKRVREEALLSKLSHLGIPITRDESNKWFTWLDVSGSGELDLYSWSNLLETDKSLHHLFTVPNLNTGKLEAVFPRLSDAEEVELRSMLTRINKIVEHAAERGVRVMVDAEQTYFQPAISRLTMEMMRKFNKEHAVVFNTYQCYLKKTHENFLIDLDLARRENFSFGCKVVRGAYMEQERDRAATIGYEDPINVDFNATTAMYEKVIDTAMQEVQVRDRGRIAVMAATHNEDTIRYCVQRLKDYRIHREDRAICFGQLLGMCDHVSFPLGQSGYSVYKYVPYGPVEEVLPYLSRRAMENRGLLAKVQKERALLWNEVKRRTLPGKKAAQEVVQTT